MGVHANVRVPLLEVRLQELPDARLDKGRAFVGDVVDELGELRLQASVECERQRHH